MKLVFASIPFIVACAHDPLTPGAGDKPGHGTNTLLVNGSVSAEPREGTSNALDPASFSTDFRVHVQLNNTTVTTGTVTVTSYAGGMIPLSFTADNNGTWVGRGSGYEEVYQLDVISGADEVTGVIVDGPDIHTYVAPLAGASLDSTTPIDVKWERDEMADTTSIRVGDLDRINIADTKLYTLAPSSLKAEKDQPRENTIELRRSNQVAPAGAIGGSLFTVSVTNTLDVVAQPNPAL